MKAAVVRAFGEPLVIEERPGARRHTRHFGLQLGRVAHRVLHHSACPVAIVPEQG
jgi:hypothetical protein